MFALFSLAACSVGPNFFAPHNDAPAEWQAKQANGLPSQPKPGSVAADWWTGFNDPVLNGLEQKLQDQNLDIQTALTRLREARAQYGIAASAAYPQLNASASYTREKPSDKGAFSLFGSGSGGGTNGGTGSGGANAVPTSNHIPPFNIWQYGFDASWELDLWGGVHRQVEAASATLQAAQEDERSMVLSVEAELARDYFQWRAVQANLKITQSDLANAKLQQALTESQAKSGLIPSSDTTSAASQTAQQAARIPQLQQQENEARNQISFLLGQNPGSLNTAASSKTLLPKLPTTVPLEVPSALLRRRPDIRAAEAQLHAATATVGVATADFYPRITLMGNGAIQAIEFHDLDEWAARTYTYGPSISLPIFQGGRLKRTLELRKAEQQEAALAYRKTVLQAFHEVDNALTAYIAEQRRQKDLAISVAQENLSVALTTSRYKKGLASYLEVLTAQQRLFNAQQQQVDSIKQGLINTIQLYKAMGGGVEPAGQT